MLMEYHGQICAKVIDPNTMEVLGVEVVETMSTMEKVFPTSCFDIMTRLVVHLVKELDICGPVHTQWMYPMERYMKALKGYARNMARPKEAWPWGTPLRKFWGFAWSTFKR
jgi:hypothetical protein